MIVVVGRTALGTQGTEELVHRCDAFPLPFTRHTACDRVHGLGLSIDHEHIRCIKGCTEELLAHRCDALPLISTHTAWDGGWDGKLIVLLVRTACTAVDAPVGSFGENTNLTLAPHQYILEVAIS